MSSKRVEMWGEGLEAKGDARSWERWARGEGRGCVLGSAPIYPTIWARGFTPGRVGKTTGANPGGYQAIAMGGISQGDHRRLRHR